MLANARKPSRTSALVGRVVLNAPNRTNRSLIWQGGTGAVSSYNQVLQKSAAELGCAWMEVAKESCFCCFQIIKRNPTKPIKMETTFLKQLSFTCGLTRPHPMVFCFLKQPKQLSKTTLPFGRALNLAKGCGWPQRTKETGDVFATPRPFGRDGRRPVLNQVLQPSAAGLGCAWMDVAKESCFCCFQTIKRNPWENGNNFYLRANSPAPDGQCAGGWGIMNPKGNDCGPKRGEL